MNITDTLKFIQLSVYGDPTRQAHLSTCTNLKGKNRPNQYPIYPKILVSAQTRANSYTNRSRERVYHKIYDNVLCMAVFDGEGNRGQTPARKAKYSMDEYFTRKRLHHFGKKWATSYDEWKTACEKAIYELFDKMDKRINHVKNEEYWDGMGTTCTLVIAVRRQNGEYWVLGANVGHSPALLFDISHDLSDLNRRFEHKLLFESHTPDNVNEYERIRRMSQVSYHHTSDVFKTTYEKVKLVYDDSIRSGNRVYDWSKRWPIFERKTKNGQEYTDKEEPYSTIRNTSVRGDVPTKAILPETAESRTATRLVGDKWWKHGIIHRPSFTFFKIPPSSIPEYSKDYPDFTAIAVGSAGFWNVWSYEDFVKRAYKEWNATGKEKKMTEKLFKLNTKQWKQFRTPAKGLKKIFSWLYKTEYPDASLVMAILQ